MSNSNHKLIYLKFLFIGFFAVLFVFLFWYRYKDAKKVKDKFVFMNKENHVGILYRTEHAYIDTTDNLVHVAFEINNSSPFNFNPVILDEVSKKSSVLITLEFLKTEGTDPSAIILSGKLDRKLQEIYKFLFSCNKQIFIRINPEMELWPKSLSWQNSFDYIKAYRYIVTKWKKKNAHLKFVWGPCGFLGTESFYPGDDVVDLISITLNSNVERSIKRYVSYPDIKNEIHRKLHRIRFFDKPVLILSDGHAYSKNTLYSFVNDEINTIVKNMSVAYNKKLWDGGSSTDENYKFQIGVYDPEKHLVHDKAIKVEHIFVDFGQIQSGELDSLLHDVFSREHNVILTVEPWKSIPWDENSNVLKDIYSGKYDPIVTKLYANISNCGHVIYFRFAHEMEIPVNRYAWQNKDPIDYIKSFRYVMNFQNPFPNNVKRIWGPAGDRGSLDFYPGNDVVDYVSFSAYALPDKNITDYKKQLSVHSLFKRKMWNLKWINKPIFITEFGVKGTSSFQASWLVDAAEILNDNKQIIGVSYFNKHDVPGAWGDIQAPDWSISQQSFHQFLDHLQRIQK